MKKISLLLSFILIFISLHAQAPVNDEPCNAIDVPVMQGDPIPGDCMPTIIYSYSNATLTPAIPNPTCGVSTPSSIRDVWYKFTAPASGSFIISTADAGLSGGDMVMTIYTATSCAGTFTEIGCNDDYNSTLYPRILANAIAGQIVYIRMFRFPSTPVYPLGDFKMCIIENLANNNPVIDNSTKVGIGINTPFAKLDVAGSGIFRDTVIFAKTIDLRSGIKIRSGAGNGKVLTSDANGNASWLPPALQANYWSLNGNDIYNNTGGNIGIGGVANPAFPLSMGVNFGDKISLYGNSINHYGLGVQLNSLQIHTDNSAGSIAFGHGSSTAFTERARIINNGTDGMSLKGRLHLLNGSSPLDVAQTGGVWLYKADNSNILSFMGTQNNNNVGFYGGPVNNGWGFVYDAINSRVGIGTNNPTSSLNVNGQVTIDQKNLGGYGGLLIKGNVPGSNYPNIAFTIKNNAASPVDEVAAMIQGDLQNNGAGTEAIDLTFLNSSAGLGGLTEKMRIKNNGNIGIGVSNPLYKLHLGTNNSGLRIEGPAAASSGGVALSIGGTGDVVIDKPGQVGGRLTIKENGAIGVGGSLGAAGQVLTSNGSGSGASWQKPVQFDVNTPTSFTAFSITGSVTYSYVSIPATARTITIPSGQNAMLLFSVTAQTQGYGCSGLGCSAVGNAKVYLDGNNVMGTSSYSLELDNLKSFNISISNIAISVGPGTHTVDLRIAKTSSNTNDFTVYIQNSTLMALPN